MATRANTKSIVNIATTCPKSLKLRKKYYFEKQFNLNFNNKKGTWKLINNLRGKVKSNLPNSFNINSEHVTCHCVIAKKFNEYFSSIAKNLNKNVKKSNAPPFETYMPPQCNNSFYLQNTDETEIMSIIEGFENSKASDNPVVVLKYCAPTVAGTISRIINKCIDTGVFPSVLKIGNISPIYRKGPKDKLANYRPISILPVFGKIFEKVIYTRLHDFLTKNKIISEFQFGFQKFHSTIHAIHDSIDFIKQSHSTSRHVLALFIDLSKAFDTIDHKILMHKLYNYGIRGLPYELILSYLSNRFQCTKFNGHNSDNEKVVYGVPQGSVIGPLLFLLYINDIQNCNMDANIK